jgi:predicted MPP superfamily phosphohydrolase
VTWILAALVVVVVGGLAYGHFEAGWVRLRTLDVPLDRLPPELDGLRIAHLADFHLGVPSRGAHSVEKAVAWVEKRRPDLVLLSGDLLSRPSGEERLRALVARLPEPTVAILGNHDFAESTRDPFSQPVVLRDLAPARLLLDEEVMLELRGKRVQVVGVDPRTYLEGESDPAERADPTADLRILLCHYPYVLDRLPAGVFDLVLAGHLHDGQICIPYPGGKIRLAHMNWRYTKGIYRRPGGVMHLSPGLGTTFVPFRFCARPEATELVLHSSR